MTPIEMMQFLQESGYALKILEDLMRDELFDDLSKHNPFWHESDKMDDLRMKISYIQDRIIEVRDILTIETDEGSL